MLHNFDRVPLAAVPSPVVGMRKVTEAVAQMVVNTLLGSSLAIGNWQLAKSKTLLPQRTRRNTEESQSKAADEIANAQVGTRNGREDLLRSAILGVLVVKKTGR